MGKTAKLFMNGRSQAVRLPAEFRFDGTEVNIRRDPETGDVVLSEPRPARGWDELFRTLCEIGPLEVDDVFWDSLRDKSPPRRDPFADWTEEDWARVEGKPVDDPSR